MAKPPTLATCSRSCAKAMPVRSSTLEALPPDVMRAKVRAGAKPRRPRFAELDRRPRPVVRRPLAPSPFGGPSTTVTPCTKGRFR